MTEGLEQVSNDPDCAGDDDVRATPSIYGSVRSRFFPPRLDRRTRLARTIEAEVIPRLLLVHRADRRAPAEPPAPAPLDAEAVRLMVEHALADRVDEGLVLIQSLLAGGASLEEIYLELLSPTARQLGDLWVDDRISFSDVTLALARLQRIMRTLARITGEAVGAAPRPGRVLLALVPGEQHSFGMLMLEEFFRRDGWEVDCLTGVDTAGLLAAVRRQPDLAAVGLSASVDDKTGRLERLVTEIRRSAINPDLLVMVGGRCFNEDPGLYATVGADFTAVDGRQAIRHIHSMLSTGPDGG